MVTQIKPEAANATTAIAETTRAGAAGTEETLPARLTSVQVWRELGHASFAVVSYVTPSGAPRSSGVVYTAVDRRLYVAVAPDSWKARHIAATGEVAVTVPVRRGGLLALLLPIPPATVSFHARAIVHPAGAMADGAVARALEPLLPPERRAEACIIEIRPRGQFLTYGLGVSLMQMRDPARSRARVPVGEPGSASGRTSGPSR